MAYCELTDIHKIFPARMVITLSNDTAGATEADEDVVAECIDQADREIDSYIATVTAVPLSTVPPLVANLSAKIAIWNLHLRKYFDSEIWYKTYKDCIDLLKMIARGEILLEPESLAESSSDSSYVTETRDQKYTDTLWKTFR